MNSSKSFYSSSIAAIGAVAVFACGLCGVARAAPAQPVQIFATAITGQPYGIATIEIPLQTPAIGQPLPPVEAIEQTGRLLYPIANDVRVKVTPPPEAEPPRRGRLLNQVRGLLQELTNGDEQEQFQTVARRVSFLFTGNRPLRVRLNDGSGEIGTYEIVPRDDTAAHAELISQWWDSYTEAAQRQIDRADYPTWGESYLIAMLAARTGLPLPSWFTATERKEDDLLDVLKLIGGADAVSDAVFRRAAIGLPPLGAPEFAAEDAYDASAEALLPLPAPPDWAPLFQNDDLQGIEVETLANQVPPECFYIRYGAFENFLWFRDLSNEYGGDISRMLTLRGFENDSAKRIEQQLNVKTTELSRALGPTVIADQALIGRDLFLGDGASMGVVMQANNVFLLRTSLMNDRTKAAQQDEDLKLTTVTIADKPVSFLSSIDNRVRSLMVVNGQTILITNSKTLVRRFFEVGQSGESLAQTAAFRLARQLMPLERDDTIFAYFSPQMLRGLMSPEYLIELRRRLHAKADVALVHLARLAAKQEQRMAADNRQRSVVAPGIDQLVDLGFLPRDFGTRPDGSGVVAVGDRIIDTLRGARGSFLPIADVEIEGVTPAESRWYAGIAEQYSQQFNTIDPIMFGIQRERLAEAPQIERVTIHAEVAPWDPGKYGKYAQQLGPPTRVAIKFAPDDIIAAQAHVASPQLGPPTHLFAAIKDNRPPAPKDFDGIFKIYQSLRRLPGYLGAWPQPGVLDRLPLGLGVGQPVGPGMSRLLGGLYRYTDGEFSVLSFQPEVLRATLPQLAAIDADDTAQVRMRVGNLNGSQLEGWVNAQLYERAREGSIAGANFLGLLSRQLNVPAEDAMDAASRILGARLQCPLGGEYRYVAESDRWVSTAWGADQAGVSMPIDYQAPLLAWFRGSAASVTQYDDRLVADVVLDVQRKK